MARVLESLKQSEGARSNGANRISPAPGPAQECVLEWTLGEDEVPFIEVGGPNKKIELSPSLVVKHPPQPKVQPPHVAGAQLTETQPMAVAFAPWPSTPAPRAIAPDAIAYHQPEHPVSKEYAALCELIVPKGAPAGARVLLLSGARPRVGTTTVLLNLAVTAARGGARRVALFEADSAHPALAARLGQQATAGVHDVLAGNLALEQAILATPLTSLSLLPAGKPSGPLTGEALAWLIGWMRSRFDLILIDGPPLAETAALAPLAALCDGIYLVLPQGEVPEVLSIPRLGGRLRGLIHTRFEV
jgi:Mrp family chromosome partitioning ATPase